MPIHRKRFRIEQAVDGNMPILEGAGEELGPMHHEIMAELRAIRAQMGSARVSAAASALAEPRRARRRLASGIQLGGSQPHLEVPSRRR